MKRSRAVCVPRGDESRFLFGGVASLSRSRLISPLGLFPSRDLAALGIVSLSDSRTLRESPRCYTRLPAMAPRMIKLDEDKGGRSETRYAC
jgi:hypothetical protein